MGLLSLSDWECGFESRRGDGYLSVANYVCGQVETSASVLSLVQRIPTECGVSERDREAPQGDAMIRNRVEATKVKILIMFNFYMSYLWIINKLLYFFHCVTS